MSSQGQGGSSPFLGQPVPVLASSVSTSVPGWGLNLSSNYPLQGLSGSAASPWSPRGYWGWGGRPACYLATSASHLCGDLAPPCSPPHVWTPLVVRLVIRLVIRPSGRVGLAQEAGPEWAGVLERRSQSPLTICSSADHNLLCLLISPESLQGHYPETCLSPSPSAFSSPLGRDPASPRLACSLGRSGLQRTASSLKVAEEVHRKGKATAEPRPVGT